MTKRKLIIAGAVLLAVVLMGVIVFAPTRPESHVTASFIGYTNAADGNRLAMFQIANHAGIPISGPERALYRRTDSWGQPQKQAVRCLLVSRPITSLRHGQSEVVSVSTPPTPGRWKAVFLFRNSYGWRERAASWFSRIEINTARAKGFEALSDSMDWTGQ